MSTNMYATMCLRHVRFYLLTVFCILASSQVCGSGSTTRTLLYFDLKTGNAEKLVELGPYEGNKLDGFQVIGYKELVFTFGGEYRIGRGDWNSKLWVFDIFRERWRRKSIMPFVRRHFECCICNEDVYIVGGSGAYRVSKDTMFVYNYKKNKWTKEISLPCTAWQVKCFNYNGNLFLLSVCNRCGYIYNSSTQEWQKVTFAEEALVVPMFSEGLSIFAYEDRIYLKGRKVLVFRMKSRKMHLDQETFLEIPPYDQMESALSDNILYTIYKRHDPTENDTVLSFEKFDLLTHQISSFWGDVNRSSYIKTTGDAYSCSEGICIFTFQHYSVNETTELVNGIES